jgi:programmed cell death 8 (apoptosis-inducing factor)
VRNSSDVAAITESGERLRVELRNGDSFETDHVVFAIGAKPNTTLAEKAFLEIDQVNGGIVANAELAARSDIYVVRTFCLTCADRYLSKRCMYYVVSLQAGDAVSFYDPYVGRRREQHHDHARISGRVAGFNMTGERKAYLYQPMFWGSVSDSAFQGVGIVDTSLTNVGVFQRGPLPTDTTNQDVTLSNEYYEKGALERGAVYYMKDKRVVGVLLWNIPDKLEDARRSVVFPRDFEDISRVQTQIDFAPAVQTDDQ